VSASQNGRPPRNDVGDDLTITDVPAARRYEARLGTVLVGWVEYGRIRTRLVALHTEVLPEYGGRGIASALVRYVLADARATGLTITPRCPFFRTHFDRHPEDHDVLAQPEPRAEPAPRPAEPGAEGAGS
jgi:predicted GNAT family acetyltransferase